MTRLLFGSFNRHKAVEIKRTLSGVVELISAAELGGLSEVAETGDTLVANAVLKAEGYSAQTGLPCVADDSGLEVDALGGAPGVHSAYYGGEHGNAPRNIAKLLATLGDAADRRARFRTVLALAVPGKATVTFEGALEGHILHQPVGTAGFGYDPVFQPTGDTRSLAEYTLDEKNAVSHRGKAVAAFRRYLLDSNAPDHA